MKTGPIKWVGGEHDFALDMGALRALQDACDAGPMRIYLRLQSGDWRVDDLASIIRLGLIGSGEMTERDAKLRVSQLFDSYPLGPFVITAERILRAAIVGVADDPVGEQTGTAPVPPQSGDGQPSTETAQ